MRSLQGRLGVESPLKPKGEGSPQPLWPHRPSPSPHLLVAEDFAVVEDLNLKDLIVVDAAGHWPLECLRREGQLWPWVETTGRGVGTGGNPW